MMFDAITWYVNVTYMDSCVVDLWANFQTTRVSLLLLNIKSLRLYNSCQNSLGHNSIVCFEWLTVFDIG